MVRSQNVLFAWLITMLGMNWAATVVGSGAILTWAVGPAIAGGALVVSLVLASFAIKPLAPFFETVSAKSRVDYIGTTCTITTGRVDAGFGQATIEDGGDVLVIAVRSDSKGAGFERDESALIIDYDNERQAYIVERVAGILADSAES